MQETVLLAKSAIESTKPSTLAAIALLNCTLLMGCAQAPAYAAVTQEEKNAYLHGLRLSALEKLRAGNSESLSGVVHLQVTHRRGEGVVDCKGIPGRNDDSLHRTLALVVEQACWNSVLPAPSASFYDEQGKVEIRAPMVFDGEDNGENRVKEFLRLERLAYRQGIYLWDRMFRGAGVDSAGVAWIGYRAGRAGRVEACMVNMRPSAVNPGAYALDAALQRRLTERCMTLDLSDMPGFEADVEGGAIRTISLDYSPWRNRARQEWHGSGSTSESSGRSRDNPHDPPHNRS